MEKRKIIRVTAIILILLAASVFIAERTARRKIAEAYFLGRYEGSNYVDISSFEITRIPINPRKPIKAVCDDIDFDIRLSVKNYFDSFCENYVENYYSNRITKIAESHNELNITALHVDYVGGRLPFDALHSDGHAFVLDVVVKEDSTADKNTIKEILHNAIEADGLTNCYDIRIYVG